MPFIPCTLSPHPRWCDADLWVVVWNARAAQDPDTLCVPANMPVRVLIEGNTYLPAYAFQQCRDLKTARVTSGPAAFRQVRAWLEEMR